MTKIFNFEKFLQMNEMNEAQAPVADVLKTANGRTVKAVRVTPGADNPEGADNLVVAYLTPPDEISPDGEVKFDAMQNTLVFTSEKFDEKFKGVFKSDGSMSEPKLLAKPGQIGASAYGILWHLACLVSGSTRPGEQEIKDTLAVVKKLMTVESYKAIAMKNKNFSEFYTSLKTNQGNPEKALGTGTMAAIPGPPDAKLIQAMSKAAKETFQA